MDFLGQGLEIRDQLLAAFTKHHFGGWIRRVRQGPGRVGDGHGQALEFAQGAHDGVAGGQGHIDDRLPPLHRLLHRIERAHFGFLRRGDAEHSPVVLGRRHLEPGIDPVLGHVQVAVGLVEVLQGYQRADIGVDAVLRHGCVLLMCVARRVSKVRQHSIKFRAIYLPF